ncbi:MAG: Coenzyme F420 hydrogenase/dehydrogenase, beta subunit C-terminal domain [Agathobacter sp.]|nr:Coenzyme F420 hydrogenase/dehydrogenase, beta subunit C-terminal domain [Agathobacter sp.]
MIQLPSKENCCGCLGCEAVCPKGAIKSIKDEDGFIYPSVDAQLCVDCGLCMKKCSFIKKNGRESEVDTVWAYRIADKEILADSTSGGAFTALSDMVLADGGVIAACIMDENFNALHILASDKTTRDRMRRSKYVQSNTEGIFQQVKQELESGKTVLFIGTPCQTAQMDVYAGVYRDKLITCDFLCHGVPNNDFFKAHIAWLEKIYGKKTTGYLFRGKKYGWNHMIQEVVFEGKKVRSDKKVQAYSRFFYAGVSLRPSCYNCRYRSTERSSDLTIADFWGIDKMLGKTDNRGYSMIAANTAKGKELVKLLKESGELIPVDKEKVMWRISEPISKCKFDRNEFWELYRKKGYSALVDRYTDTSTKASVIHNVKKRIKRILNRI